MEKHHRGGAQNVILIFAQTVENEENF